jgi:glycyl-tRNA synthetase
MDAIGTPYCITIDHQTLQDDTVTIRDRDSMKQERISISKLKSKIQDSVSIATLLKQI